MANAASVFNLDNITVRQQGELFSLGDLHTASGGEEKHKSSNFLRLDTTQALIAEMAKGSDVSLFLQVVKGRNGGTYACRELVIAYAAWISAAFHLKSGYCKGRIQDCARCQRGASCVHQRRACGR